MSMGGSFEKYTAVFNTPCFIKKRAIQKPERTLHWSCYTSKCLLGAVKDTQPLKFFLLLVDCIIRNTAMQHLEFMSMSFTLHHMMGSCSGADGHKVATMYSTPSKTISQSWRREGKKTHFNPLNCAGVGDLCHNLISENTKEKFLF
jgi:hypothetical protein